MAGNMGEWEKKVVFLLFVIIAAFNVSLVALSSSGWGMGIPVFTTVANPVFSDSGDLLMLLAAALCGIFYVLGVPFAWWPWQWLAGFAVWLVLCAAFLLKSVTYPWAPTVLAMLTMVFLLCEVRREFKEDVNHQRFAQSLGFIFLIFAVLLASYVWCFMSEPDSRWILKPLKDAMHTESNNAPEVYKYFSVDYGKDCLTPDTSGHRTEEQDRVDAGCAKANTVIIITWAMPFAAAWINAVLSLLFLLLSCHASSGDGLGEWQTWKQQQRGFAFIFALTVILGGLYIACYLGDVSNNLGQAVLGMCFAGLLLAFRWIYVECWEMDHNLSESAKPILPKDEGTGKAPSVQMCGTKCQMCAAVEEYWKSNWLRAMATGSFFVPLFLALESIRQGCFKDKCLYRPPEEDRGVPLEEKVRNVAEDIKKWPWTDVLLKICILGEIFFVLQVLGTKATYVFLAWMNEQLAESSLQLVIAIAFSVGFVMFLLPPVPGVPVYIFCGIVIVARGSEELTFLGACFVAILVSLTLKLVACTGQYLIGRLMGRSVSVRNFVGTDTKVTRAIEVIVQEDRLCTPAKVAVLVGGPDWPTSVVCGILQVSLWKMLLGTLWCFFSASPCVLAGAFLATKQEGEKDEVGDFLGSFFTLLAAAVQMGSMLWATYAIAETLRKDSSLEEIDYTIPKYKELKEYRKNEEKFNEHFTAALEWKKGRTADLPNKVLLCLAALCIAGSGYAFAGIESVLFENFSVSGKISKPLDEYGLGNDPLAIVKGPGWIAIAIFALGTIFHFAFYQIKQCEARAAMKKEASG